MDVQQVSACVDGYPGEKRKSIASCVRAAEIVERD